MAYIKYLETGDIEYLREYHSFGRRAEAVDTQLDYPFVSKLHFIIEWRDPSWLIRDMSHNGVWINGERLAPQIRHELKEKDIIQIADHQGVSLKVCNLEKPEDMLFRSDQKLEKISLTESILLPDEITPEFGIYKCTDRNQWFAEQFAPLAPQSDDESEDEPGDHNPYESGPYQHNDVIQCSDAQWCFFLVNKDDPTIEFQAEDGDITDVEFRFDISQDEETTQLTLTHQHREIDLGERSHHYLLAYLLRCKHAQLQSLQDSQTNTPQYFGWINCQLIEQELGIDQSYINLLIFRARKQLQSKLASFRGNSQILDRRRGSIRMAIDNYSIYKEGVREA